MLTVPGLDNPVTLCTPTLDVPLSKSRDIVLRGGGFGNEHAALALAYKLRDALSVTFARLDMGADFGGSARRSFFTRHGLAMIEESTGQRALNDVHGVLAFEEEPSPRFISMGPSQLIRTMQPDRFECVLAAALDLADAIPERESLAFELYHASFFESGSRSRFLTLMIAIEALLEPELRSEVSRLHLASLVEATRTAPNLTSDEKKSLEGALRSLGNVSTRAKARRLAEARLGDRLYDSVPGLKFYERCYALRNRMVHGGRHAEESETGHLAANLEVFVAHLLGHRLLHVDA